MRGDLRRCDRRVNGPWNGIWTQRGNDGDQKGIMAGKVAEFKKRFLEKYPSDMCREILGHDISKLGEMDKVLEKGLMFDLCPQIVLDVLSILEELV